MSVLTLEAKLERQDSSTPWGFRMQGGKDFSSPVSIARVNPGSLAAKCGLQQGDIILKIGSRSSETLKHKDAQDAIISYGNKLDLLLQRIREKKTQNGYGGGTQSVQSYDKFSTPTIGTGSYQSPASFNQPTNTSYNAAPKPFGSSKPAPYNAPVDNLSQQTSNMNINAAPATSFASKYADVEDRQGPGSHQSRSFKFLQTTLDSGQEPPAGLRPTVDLRRSPSPNAGVNKQFNSPMGLYSNTNLPKPGVTENSADGTNNGEEDPKYDSQGKRLYRPSETFKLIQEQENASEPQEKPADVKQTRTFKALEKQLGESQYNSVGDNGLVHASKAIVIEDPNGAHMSQTFQRVYEHQVRPQKAEIISSDQTRLPPNPLDRLPGDPPVQSAPAPPPPAPAPVRAPPASKPGVWTPGQNTYSAPAKPFSANPPPAAPAAPAAPPAMSSVGRAQGTQPPKPTGVGAMRGKIGDAVVRKNEAGLVPVCNSCGTSIRGPFVTAMGKSWCPDHFICANPRCGNKLIDMGFVEEGGFLYCEKDYEVYFAPKCGKCDSAIVGECVNALNKQYHPACFLCHHCKQPIGGTQFHLEDGNPFCENDWRQLYQTMCSSCNFPIEPGDKWVEALNNNYHSECFNCSTCQVNLEGQAFYAKSGKPYCKKHAR